MSDAQPQNAAVPTDDVLGLDTVLSAGETASLRPEPTRSGGRRLALRVIVVLIGLGGFPLLLHDVVTTYEATNDGLWLLLVPVLAVIGWMVLVVGVWNVGK